MILTLKASFLSVLTSAYKVWPFIIVVPTSLLSNWYNEIRKWAPDVIPVIYSGSRTAREHIRKYEIFPDEESNVSPSALKCHVILTNYEMVMNEAQLFQKIDWKVLVCDEGHRLKNDAAKTFNAFTKLSMDHKIVLTGTPLQNNMKELFSLMKFLVFLSWP